MAQGLAIPHSSSMDTVAYQPVRVEADYRACRVVGTMNVPAPSLAAGSHLHQVVPAATVPAPVPYSARWRVCQVGDRWGAFQPWAGSVYWLRLFQSYSEAMAFVADTVQKAARTT